MQGPAVRYLTIRSLGAPAVLLSLAMQGVFRGFKDTRTPLYATGKNTLVCDLHSSFTGENTSLEPSSQLLLYLKDFSYVRQNYSSAIIP
jgi:hypothetical protein